MPQVASDAKSHALKLPQPHSAARHSQAADRAPATPFESLLDDQAAPASERVSPRADDARVSRSTRTQEAQAAAKPKAGKPDKAATADHDAAPAAAGTDHPDVTAENAEKSDNAGKPENPWRAQLAAMAGAQHGATGETTTDAQPAELPPEQPVADGTMACAIDPAAALALADPAAPLPAEPIDTVIIATAANDAVATTVASPVAGEAAVAEDSTVIADAARTAAFNPAELQPKADKADKADKAGKAEKSDQADGQADAAKTAIETSTVKAAPPQADGKPAPALHADGKPTHTAHTDGAPAPTARADGKPAHTDADKDLIAQARGEAPANPHRAGAEVSATASADGNGAATKTTTDAAQPTHTITAPPHIAASSSPAGAPQPLPQAAAVPLAGVAVEIASKAVAGKNHFEIRLDPPELGRIEVRLDVDRNGHVTSRLIADRQDTLDLLRRDSAGLERALQDAGLKTSDNGLQFSLRDQASGQQQRDRGADTARLVIEDESLPAIEAIPQNYGRLGSRSGGLDIRV